MCQKALEEAKGDLNKAREILRKKGAEIAEKKAERQTGQGAIFTYVHHNRKIGAMVSLLCETDFVALNEDFKQLGNDIAMQVASIDPEDSKALLESSFIKDQNTTIEQLVKDNILKLGENITIGKFMCYRI